MSNSVQSERSQDRSAETEPTMAELLDPAALERRLREARERRAEAIRARQERAREAGEAPAPAPRPMPRALALPEGSEIPNRPAPPRPAWTGAPAAPAPSVRPRAEPPAEEPAPRTPPRVAAERAAEPRRAPQAPPPLARSGWTPPPAPRDPAPAEPVTKVPPAAEQVKAPPAPPILMPGTPISPAKPREGGVINGLPALLLAIFLIGLVGGGAAVLFAPASFRARIAAAIAPAPEQAAAPERAPASGTPETGAPETAAPETDVAAISAQPVPPPAPRAPQARPEPAPAETSAPPAAMETLPGAPAEEAPPAAGTRPPGLAESETDPALAAALPRELAVPAAPAAIGPLRLPELAADQAADEQVASLPAPPADPSLPETDLVLDPAPAAAPPAAAPAETPEARAALAEARISVNYPASAAGTANEIAAALRAAGAVTANVVPVGFSVSATNVRFYHPEDRAAAEAVAAVAANGGPAEIRDFTNFRPQPLPGVVEVWLRGAGGGGGGSGPSVARSSAAEPARTPRQAAAPARDLEAEAVERQLLSREVERMLRQQGQGLTAP